jgi:hypothetical protein
VVGSESGMTPSTLKLVIEGVRKAYPYEYQRIHFYRVPQSPFLLRVWFLNMFLDLSVIMPFLFSSFSIIFRLYGPTCSLLVRELLFMGHWFHDDLLKGLSDPRLSNILILIIENKKTKK